MRPVGGVLIGAFAEAVGRRRPAVITVPVLLPYTAAFAAGVVAPAPTNLVSSLVESLQVDMVCREHDIAAHVFHPASQNSSRSASRSRGVPSPGVPSPGIVTDETGMVPAEDAPAYEDPPDYTSPVNTRAPQLPQLPPLERLPSIRVVTTEPTPVEGRPMSAFR